MSLAKLKIEGGKRVAQALRAKSLKGRVKLSVEVGFATPYAVKIHEDLAMRHPNGGQAKYLESPARRMQTTLRRTVREYLKSKRSLEGGLRRAGEMLLNAARQLVPVDTGRLRDSGFVKVS